jgi:hypothetical protein
MITPLMLLALGLVALFPAAAIVVSDGLAMFLPAALILTPVSWLARYDVVGVLLIVSAFGLTWKRLQPPTEKKLL